MGFGLVLREAMHYSASYLISLDAAECAALVSALLVLFSTYNEYALLGLDNMPNLEKTEPYYRGPNSLAMNSSNTPVPEPSDATPVPSFRPVLPSVHQILSGFEVDRQNAAIPHHLINWQNFEGLLAQTKRDINIE